MTDMTLTKARELLGLVGGESDQQVSRRYRAVAKKIHPDHHPTEQKERLTAEMERLTAARDLVLADLRAGRNLVVATPTDLLIQHFLEAREVEAERREQEELKNEAEQVVSKLVRFHTSRRRDWKRRATAFSAIAGAAGVLTVRLPFATVEYGSLLGVLLQAPMGLNTLSPFCFLVAALFGGLAYFSSNMAKSLQTVIEEVGESLTDKMRYLDVFREIVGQEQNLLQPFSQGQLGQYIEQWLVLPKTSALQRVIEAELNVLNTVALGLLVPPYLRTINGVAKVLGRHDFAEFFLAKGKQLKLLKEEWQAGTDGAPILTYSLIPGQTNAPRSRGHRRRA